MASPKCDKMSVNTRDGCAIDDKAGGHDTTDQGNIFLDPLWNCHILKVKPRFGIRSGTMEFFKKFLAELLDDVDHKIRPSQKSDKFVFIHFNDKLVMKKSERRLNSQTFMNCRLKANIPPKRKFSKRKEEALEHQNPVVDEPYEKQVRLKMENLKLQLASFCSMVAKKFPVYDAMIQERKLKYEGILCPIDPMVNCEPHEENTSRDYGFTINVSEDGKYGLKFITKDLQDIESSNIYCPEHVMKAAMVFEKLLQVSADPTSVILQWKKLDIHTNTAKELMLTVFWKCPKELEDEQSKHLCDTLKKFYTNGEGKDCNIASLHMKIMSYDYRTGVLVIGKPHIEETVSDLVYPIVPFAALWNCSKGAEILCKTIFSVLQLGKESNVVAISCGILIGLYLAKNCGEVLFYPKPSTELAKHYAERNNITNVNYFDCDRGTKIKFEEFADGIKYKDFCAVIDVTVKAFSPPALIMQHLRRMEGLKKVLLIEMNTTEDATFPLMQSPEDKDIGEPFFPSKVTALNLFPHQRAYVKLTLFERISKDELARTVVADLEREILLLGKRSATLKRRMRRKEKQHDRERLKSGGKWSGRNKSKRYNIFPNRFGMAPSLLGDSPWTFPNNFQQQQTLTQEEYRRGMERTSVETEARGEFDVFQFAKRDQNHQDISNNSLKNQAYNTTFSQGGNVSAIFDNRTSYDQLFGRVGRNFVQRYGESSAGIRKLGIYARRDNAFDLRQSGQPYSPSSSTFEDNSAISYNRQVRAPSRVGTQYNERFMEGDFDNNAKRIRLDNTYRSPIGYRSTGRSTSTGRGNAYSRW